MGKYIIQRVLQAIPLIFIVTLLIFILMKISGDPLAYLVQDPRVTERDRMLLRAKYGLDDPLTMQFVHWVFGDEGYERQLDTDQNGEFDTTVVGERRGIIRGDFGESIRYRKPVTQVIGQFLPNTLLLGTTALVLTIVLALVIGVFAALRQYTLADNIITAGAFITYSMPSFLLALVLVQIFSIQFRRWGLPSLPVSGMYDPRGDQSIDELVRHMILPVATLALINIASWSRYIRSTMLEVISSDYIRTARAKGISERRVVFLHALKNASLPLVTLVGLNIPFILSGAVITETIFSWPGMGYMYINALDQFDAQLVVAFVLMLAIAVAFFQLLTDVIYAWLDPRIRYD
ncbi:MAG TPA: ABC transporter permease [Phototrophicaceae bacterium]|nr:ABC transporter permease [Phototrophicaceae bacterium]